MTDAQGVEIEPDLATLDFVWDVEEELDDYDLQDDPEPDEHGRQWVRELRRWRAVAVNLELNTVPDRRWMQLVEQHGETHIIQLDGGVSIRGDVISVRAEERQPGGEIVRWWTIRPTASPVRHRPAG